MTDQSRLVLEAVLRSHRRQLVSVARHRLGNRRQDAEEIVQELCIDVLAGHVDVPPDPAETLPASGVFNCHPQPASVA